MKRNSLRTPLDALRFAIDFAQTDLERAELKVLSNRVRQFFVLVPNLVRGKPWPLDVLRAVQTDVLRLLNGVVVTGVSVADVHLQIFVGRADIGRSRLNSTQVYAGVNGSLRDRFLYRLIRLLEELGVEKLRACPAPKCGRLFFKVTRKEFCSTKCQARVYMRQYRQEQTTSARRRSRHGKTTRTR